MPKLDGVSAARLIKAHAPETSVGVLSARTDDASAARVLDAGATGLLCKESVHSGLALAIRVAPQGRPHFGARIASVVARARGHAR